MEERKKLTQMLKDFQAEQKELLAQAEQRLEVLNFYHLIFFHQYLQKFSFVLIEYFQFIPNKF